MIIGKEYIVGKIRTAIDDITPAGTTDSFTSDVDDELWQAVQHAVEALTEELPVSMMDVTVEPIDGTIDTDRGFAYGTLEDDFLRFVSIDITGTAGILCELIEPGSDAAMMQRSAWSRGSASKPKAMLDYDENGNRVIVWWPGDSNHKKAQLTYIAKPEVVTTATEEVTTVPSIVCPIRDEAERLIIYRAASIFFEAKKESSMAESFRTLSTNY